MKRWIRFSILLALGCFQAAAEDLGKMSPWESDDGRMIEARVISISASEQTVRLERKDGHSFSLSWDRLSQADQQRLQAAVGNPPMPKAGTATASSTKAEAELPESIELKDVPMIEQKDSYCVPASAAMIANFHGIETNQDQIAQLSSEMSASNQGTYPSDMLLAMQKLGFKGRPLHWEKSADFFQSVLPQIRRFLVEAGPIYISFRPNVFGSMGHGCVIVGYDDRKEELLFHNPWGNKFESTYERVAVDAYGIVLIEAPEPAPIATEAFANKIKSVVPRLGGDFLALTGQLELTGIGHRLVWCSRLDARQDKRFARDTARDDGRMILELAFERNPAVLIPHSEDGKTRRYYYVTRPPEGGARFLVRRIDEHGWSQPELETLGSLTRHWATAFTPEDMQEEIWELPMIELHPISGL